MNNLRRLAVAAFLLGKALVLGQDTNSPLDNVPPPKAPFVARAPEQSAWLIVINPATSSSHLSLPRKYLQAQLWTKSGAAMQCSNVWSDGTRTEDTVVGPAKFAQSPDGGGVHLYSPRMDPRYHDFSVSDFEMLDWITPENYVGAFNHAGQTCYLFRTEGVKDATSELHNQSLAEINTPSSPTSVYISIRTGLPVEIVNARDDYRFQFGSPGELKIPEDQPPPAVVPPPPATKLAVKPKTTKPSPTAPMPVKKPDPGGNNDSQIE